MKVAQLTIAVENTFMDFSNYKQPVQYYLDNKIFWDLVPGFKKKTDIFVKKNKANFIDDLVQLGQSSETSFLQITDYREQVDVEEADFQFLSVFIRADEKYDMYERRVYSIGDLLGQMGGLYQSVFVIGTIFVFVFSERLFISSILRKIYQIDMLRETQIKQLDKQRKDKIRQLNNEKSQISIKPKLIDLTQDKLKDDIMNEFDALDKSDDIENKAAKQQSILAQLREVIVNRSVFTYGYLNVLQYIFCCIECRK
mmetsp:Transcript_7032/g.7961  ORF Transcript_7032/g.7961 Transcript_7032/m.7961 type:complete len:255 (-) Transcript_7032:179-943(-)